MFTSLTMLVACRTGLPPEPPGADAADAANASAPYRLPANPYETSAFAGEPAPGADGHAGHGNMNHGSMGNSSMGNMGNMDHSSMGNMDHGSDHTSHGAAPKKAADSQAMPPNMPMPEAPR